MSSGKHPSNEDSGDNAAGGGDDVCASVLLSSS